MICGSRLQAVEPFSSSPRFHAPCNVILVFILRDRYCMFLRKNCIYVIENKK